MRTIIVRVYTAADGDQDELHGVIETPGGPSTRFTSDTRLLAEIRRLARGERTASGDSRAPGAALSPPEASAGE